MANKRIHKSKKRLGYYAGEKLSTLTENQVEFLKNQACLDAADLLMVVSVAAVKRVFKNTASNPKLEQYIIELASLLEDVGDDKVSLDVLVADLEAMSSIRYDFKNREWTNMKRME